MATMVDVYYLKSAFAPQAESDLAISIYRNQIMSTIGETRHFKDVFFMFLRRMSLYQVSEQSPEMLQERPGRHGVIDTFLVRNAVGENSEQDVVKVLRSAPGHYELRFNSSFEKVRMIFFPQLVVNDSNQATCNLTYGLVKATDHNRPSQSEESEANQATDVLAHASQHAKAQLLNHQHVQLFSLLKHRGKL